MGQQLYIDLSYENNLDTLAEDSAYPCDPGMDSRFDSCMDEKLPLKLNEEFGCTLPIIPGPQDIPICDPDEVEVREKVFNR